MNFQNKNNEFLLKDLKSFVSEERKILNLILRHLREVERRKLHLEMGYSNLYVFCTKELGYSEAGAHRRISAMRLIKEIPEVEIKIQEGTLNLSVISKAQTYFKQNRTTPQEKKEILNTLENKSARESEKFLLSLSPQTLPPERQKVVSPEHTEIHLVLMDSAMAKLNQVKAKLSHKNPSMAEIFEMGLDLLIQKHNASLPPTRRLSISKESQSSSKGLSRYIPRQVKREIEVRDNGVCQYRDPKTGRLCGSRFYIQFDHVIPFARGGRTEAQNLRLLCSNHNKFQWERIQSKEPSH